MPGWLPLSVLPGAAVAAAVPAAPPSAAARAAATAMARVTIRDCMHAPPDGRGHAPGLFAFRITSSRAKATLCQRQPEQQVTLCGSDAGLGLGAAGCDRVHEGGVVTFGLFGVAGRETGHSLVELVRAAEVGGDREAVAGAGVGPGQGPRAQLAVVRQLLRPHPLDRRGVLPVPQLAYVVVGIAAGISGALPAEEDVAGRLHQPLARDHP